MTGECVECFALLWLLQQPLLVWLRQQEHPEVLTSQSWVKLISDQTSAPPLGSAQPASVSDSRRGQGSGGGMNEEQRQGEG